MFTKRFHRRQRSGFGKLEVLLVIAFLSLLFQVFPALWTGMLFVLDVRNWGRGAWLAFNFVVIFALFAIRFGPDIVAGREKKAAMRRKVRTTASSVTKHAKDIKEMDAAEQRELFKRMQEARRKQII
jgi:hypothetical protein